MSVGAAVVPGCANWKRIAAGLFALGLIWSAGATGARAAPAQGGGPPNFVLGVGTPVSISAADRMLRARMTPTSKKTALHLPVRRSLTALSTSAVTCGTSTTLPVEISTLAASLKCDPDLIFEYVYNNIEYEPLFGSNKGPLGTLLDQRGDDSDQAQLFGALLSAAGFSSSQVSYIYGYIRVTGAQAVGWLGVKNDAVAIQNLIANGGTPINAMVPNTGGTLNYIDIAHVWVKVTIGGTDYVFDPSFKQHTINTGLSTSLATVMGYTQSQFLTDAGGTIDSVSIRSVNRAAARTDLNTYAQNIINYIMGHNPAATVNDIVGGKVIQPVTGSPLRNTALSYISPTQPSGYPANWGSSVPNAYRTCFSISMPTVTPTSCTSPSSSTIALYTDQTYGHRITVFSVPSGSNYIPTLLIDGAAPPNGTNTGPATAGGANWAVNVQITHPYASTALANANQTGVLNMAAGGNYLISSGWGQVGRGMVEKHRQLLSQARAAGAAANSEVVLGESLAIVSYTWLAENASAVRLRDGVAAATTQIHHGLGVTAQGLIQGASGTIGPYIDTPLNYISIQPQTAYTGSCIAPTVLGSFFGTWGTASSMEAAVLEQTQALTTGMIAASTIRLVDNNAATGARTYFADGTTSGGLSAYFSTIRPNLTATYALPDIAKIDNAISSNGTSSGSPTGNQAMIPINGAQTVGSYWSGAGYGITAQACPTGMPYTLSAIQWITGALNGGSTGVNVPTTGGAGTPIISSNSQTLTTPPSADALIPAAALAAAHSTSNPLVGNPVDGVSGGYVYSHTDLTTGGGGFPYALSFSREYSSSSYTSDSGLGNGWSHNFTMGASLTSDPYIGLGDRAPIATAPVGSSLAGAGESSAIAAAQAIAATYVSQDLLSGSQSAQNMTISSISERWLTDQLTNNAVMASAPTSSGEFTWLPHADGAASISYAPPAGGAGTLTGTTPDAYGNPTVFTYVGKDQSRVAYSAIGSAGNGQIASWTTPYGMSLTYSYDSSSRLTQVSNTLGRSINLTYSGAHVASVSDDTGRSVSYSYSAAGDMVAASDPLGAVTTFAYDRTGTYDSNGHLTQVYYPSGRGAAFVTNWYDALGRVAQQADANNNRITFYVAGTRTEAVNPAGARQVSYQTPRGMITMQAAVLDNTLGNVFSDTATGAKVNVVTNQYDGADRLVLATAPEGGTTGYAYSPDLMQNVVSVTATPKTGSGLSPLTTTTTYDALYNKPVTVTDPRGLVSAMTYDPSTGNLLKTVADVGGSGHFNVTSRFTYNGVGQMVMGTDPKGVKTLAVYDAQGNLASITSDYGGANITATATYSPLGDVLTATDPEGNTTKLVYDAARRLSTVTLPSTGGSAAPVMTAFTYNADGELLTTTQSAGGVVLSTVNTTYTATGNVATASDPKGNVVRYSYDNVDRVSSVMDPVGNITSVGYDALSRATASYNTAIQSSPLVRQAYTADGLTASQTVARSNSVADTTAYGYDGLDRPSTVTFPDASTEAYSYDADSNVLARKTRAGATIGFSYDTLNRLIAKTPPSSPVVSYAYDITGNIVGVSDTSASIASPSASASFSQSATYDALNRPISLSWTPAATQTTPTATSATFTYGYDANNRRTSQAASDNSWLGYPAASAAVTSYTANSLNQYSAVGAVTPTYDGNGALTYDGQYTYAYNVESRLLSVKIGASTVATYAYDAQLRRKSKTVGASITVYVTDEADNGVLDYDGATGAVLHWYPAGSQVDVGAGTRSTFITDIQGSVIGMLSSSGTLTKFGYQPFGENPNLTTDGYRYTGQQLDAETAGSTAEPSGLYYLRARTYSPTWGRFLQPDPAKSTTNLYAYASNDPLNLSDPSGLANCDGSPSSSNDPDPAGALSSVTALSYCPAEWKTLLDAQRELLALYDSQHSPNVAVPINPAPTPTPTPTPAPTPTPKPTPVDEVTVVATRRQAYIPATPVQVLQLSIYVPNIQVSLSGSVSAAKQTPVWCKAEKSSKQLSSTGVVLAVTGVVAAEIPPLAAILEFGAAAADVGSVYYGVVAGVQKGRATGDYSSLGAAVAGFFVSRAAGMKPAPSAIAGKTGEGVSSIGDTSCEVK